jgi:3D (Asp-Asp-Asp) domain-containing protein
MPGWPVYVPGYGFATIEDIGAGIAGRDWIDLGYSDEDYQVWHTPVPPLDLVPYILP